MNWSERYANSEYYNARTEYLNRFVYKGLKDTQEAKDFYKNNVIPKKPPSGPPSTPPNKTTQPGPEPEPQRPRQISYEKMMQFPDYLGPGAIPGRGSVDHPEF